MEASGIYMGQLNGLVALVEKHAAHGRGIEPSGVDGVQLGGSAGVLLGRRQVERREEDGVRVNGCDGVKNKRGLCLYLWRAVGDRGLKMTNMQMASSGGAVCPLSCLLSAVCCPLSHCRGTEWSHRHSVAGP